MYDRKVVRQLGSASQPGSATQTCPVLSKTRPQGFAFVGVSFTPAANAANVPSSVILNAMLPISDTRVIVVRVLMLVFLLSGLTDSLFTCFFIATPNISLLAFTSLIVMTIPESRKKNARFCHTTQVQRYLLFTQNVYSGSIGGRRTEHGTRAKLIARKEEQISSPYVL